MASKLGAIPDALLDVLGQYCTGDGMNSLKVVKKALDMPRSSGVNRALSSAIAVHPAMKAHFAANAAAGVPMTATAVKARLSALGTTAKAVSPHAPVPKGKKKPYWFKVVSSVDFKQVNGYGIKGKLVNASDIAKLSKGSIVVAQTKYRGDTIAYVLVKALNPSTNATIEFPRGSTEKSIVIPGWSIQRATRGYRGIFGELARRGF